MDAMTDKVIQGVRQRMGDIGKSQGQAAQDLDIQRVNLTRMLNGRSGALPKNWAKLLDYLGLELVVQPKKSGK